MKMSGADFRAFLDCKDPSIWPPGLYIEEELLRIDGDEIEELPESFDPASIIEIMGGSTAWESSADRERATPTLRTLARRWIKMQTTVNVVVSIPKKSMDQIASAVAKIGGKVLMKYD